MERIRGMFRRRFTVFTMIVMVAASATYVAGTAYAKRAPRSDGPWEVPRRAERKKNPFPADRASLDAGRKIYVAECLDCHGRRGAGDGPGARELKGRVPDLGATEVWKQSDGALFYKLSTGRGDMPGFDDMLEEPERWHVLNYTRATFGPRDGDAGVASGKGQGK